MRFTSTPCTVFQPQVEGGLKPSGPIRKSKRCESEVRRLYCVCVCVCVHSVILYFCFSLLICRGPEADFTHPGPYFKQHGSACVDMCVDIMDMLHECVCVCVCVHAHNGHAACVCAG